MRAVGGFLSAAIAAILMVGCSDSPTATVPDTDDGTSPGNVLELPDDNGTPGEEMYRTVMSGAQEVPAVSTLASGSASFHMSSDGASIVYAITVSRIENVTDAHIHAGAPGEVGPPVVDLFDGVRDGEYNGLLAQGRISASDLVGPLEGMTLADLHALVTSGRAYLNVHTTRHPAGEIRGQVTTIPAQEDDDGEET
jgi:hypothetical protein